MQIETDQKADVIKRFHLEAKKGYSEFWRKNKSPVEVIELARLLIALRKIASHIGKNTGEIVWSGMNLTHGIALNPEPIMGEYPIPAAKTDVMVGMTVQRALENTEWSDRLKSIAQSRLELPPHYRYKLNLYLEMCEKVYLDCLSNQSVLGIYCEKARNFAIREQGKEFIQPPTVTELFHIWWKMAADINGQKYKQDYVDRSVGGLVERGNLEKFYKAPIALLNSIVDPLINECPKITGVSERIQFRLDLYLSIWSPLLEQIKFWPGDRSDPFLLSDETRDDIEKETKEKKAVKATILSLVEPIEAAIRKKNPDYTDKVKSNVKNVDDVVKIEGNDIVMRTRNRMDKELFHRLQLEFKMVARRMTCYNRGLTSGKIDRRRLYRAATNGTAFQLKNNNFHIPNDFVLLVDATGSMSEPTKWDRTQTLFQTLFSAISVFNKKARLLAYNEVKNTCRLSELYVKGEFYTVLPHGQTASGEAIIATGLKLENHINRPFIIHITDGASNWGCGVRDAIEFCRKRRIHLLTLGVDCSPSSKQSLREEYGKRVQFLDDMKNLPFLVKSLLRYHR